MLNKVLIEVCAHLCAILEFFLVQGACIFFNFFEKRLCGKSKFRRQKTQRRSISANKVINVWHMALDRTSSPCNVISKAMKSRCFHNFCYCWMLQLDA